MCHACISPGGPTGQVVDPLSRPDRVRWPKSADPCRRGRPMATTVTFGEEWDIPVHAGCCTRDLVVRMAAKGDIVVARRGGVAPQRPGRRAPDAGRASTPEATARPSFRVRTIRTSWPT